MWKLRGRVWVNNSFPGQMHTKWRQQLFCSYGFCGLSVGAGNNNFFWNIYIFVPVWVIHCAANRPENTVVLLHGHYRCSPFCCGRLVVHTQALCWYSAECVGFLGAHAPREYVQRIFVCEYWSRICWIC